MYQHSKAQVYSLLWIHSMNCSLSPGYEYCDIIAVSWSSACSAFAKLTSFKMWRRLRSGLRRPKVSSKLWWKHAAKHKRGRLIKFWTNSSSELKRDWRAFRNSLKKKLSFVTIHHKMAKTYTIWVNGRMYPSDATSSAKHVLLNANFSGISSWLHSFIPWSISRRLSASSESWAWGINTNVNANRSL